MITTDNNGGIVVMINSDSYHLDSHESYMELLLWITSPDPAIVIDPSVFDIDQSSPKQIKEKLERYGSFLNEFVKRRDTLLRDASTMNFSQREEEIDALLRRLTGD